MRLLIENGADLNVINTYKNSALISAIIEGNNKKKPTKIFEKKPLHTFS